MKLFKFQIERGRDAREVLVHAEEEENATEHLMKRYTGWEVIEAVEIVGEAHFTIALLDPET